MYILSNLGFGITHSEDSIDSIYLAMNNILFFAETIPFPESTPLTYSGDPTSCRNDGEGSSRGS